MYVLLDDAPPQQTDDAASTEWELAVAQERIRGLEEHAAFLQRQLELEQERNAELVSELKAERQAATTNGQQRPWWRF